MVLESPVEALKLADDPRALNWGMHMTMASRALERAGDNAVDIAEQFVDYFKNGVVRNSTNLAGLADPSLTPYLRLAEDLGGLAAQLAGGRVKSVTATYQGHISGFEVGPITQSAVAIRMSAARASSSAMPTQTPWRAQMIGFWSRAILWKLSCS